MPSITAGNFTSPDASQNQSLKQFQDFLNNTLAGQYKIAAGPSSAKAIRNGVGLTPPSALPFNPDPQGDTQMIDYKGLMQMTADSQTYDENTQFRLFFQLPLGAPPIQVSAPDPNGGPDATGVVEQGYVNAAQFAANLATTTNQADFKALLDSVYPGPNNQHLAEGAFPNG